LPKEHQIFQAWCSSRPGSGIRWSKVSAASQSCLPHGKTISCT
jgi:hypothetical protein